MRRILLVVVLLPGIGSLLWILGSQVLGTLLRPRKAGRDWPQLADRLGLSFEQPAGGPGRRAVHARLHGTYGGRRVSVEAASVRGSGQTSASEQTLWQTATPCPLRIESKALLAALTSGSGPKSGDDAFDRSFAIEGQAEDLERFLSPAARQAITTVNQVLGGFKLDAGSLTTTSEVVHSEPEALASVLAWQAWVLDAIEEGRGAAPPMKAAPAMSRLGSYLICLGLMCASGLGAWAVQTSLPPAASGSALEPGDRGLANYRGEGRSYPAVVVEAGGLVVYQDGASEWITSPERFVPSPLAPGLEVDVTAGAAHRPASIVARQGDALRVRNPDGTELWTAASCISLPSAALVNGNADGPRARARVLAPWQAQANWLYPAVVVEREPSELQVVFLDGSVDRCSPERVRPLQLSAGDALEVQRDGIWAAAVYLRGIDFAIQFEQDGLVAWTALARVRLPTD